MKSVFISKFKYESALKDLKFMNNIDKVSKNMSAISITFEELQEFALNPFNILDISRVQNVLEMTADIC